PGLGAGTNGDGVTAGHRGEILMRCALALALVACGYPQPAQVFLDSGNKDSSVICEESGGGADAGATARFNHPADVAIDSCNVYVADTGNHTIRKVTAAGVVTTLAGTAGMSGSADGTGATARFNRPTGVAADSAGNLYVADQGNDTIRK